MTCYLWIVIFNNYAQIFTIAFLCLVFPNGCFKPYAGGSPCISCHATNLAHKGLKATLGLSFWAASCPGCPSSIATLEQGQFLPQIHLSILSCTTARIPSMASGRYSCFHPPLGAFPADDVMFQKKLCHHHIIKLFSLSKEGLTGQIEKSYFRNYFLKKLVAYTLRLNLRE